MLIRFLLNFLYKAVFDCGPAFMLFDLIGGVVWGAGGIAVWYQYGTGFCTVGFVLLAPFLLASGYRLYANAVKPYRFATIVHGVCFVQCMAFLIFLTKQHSGLDDRLAAGIPALFFLGVYGVYAVQGLKMRDEPESSDGSEENTALPLTDQDELEAEPGWDQAPAGKTGARPGKKMGR